MNRRNLMTGAAAVAATAIAGRPVMAAQSPKTLTARESVRRLQNVFDEFAQVKGYDDWSSLSHDLREHEISMIDTSCDLFRLSEKTGYRLEDTIRLYARTARAAEGVPHDRVLRMTETALKTFPIGSA